MTGFVKYVFSQRLLGSTPHELVPQISWQLTDNLVPLNIFYSHSESKAFMEIRQPLAFRPTVKQALCLREQYLYLYMYECISLCILNLYKPYHLYTDFVI